MKNFQEKYFITGFSGFVSYWFCEFLNRQNEGKAKIEILGVDVNAPPDFEVRFNFKNLNIRFLSLNLLDSSSLEIAIHSFYPNYIVHLASLSSVGQSWQDPIGCFMNNTNVFLNLVEAVRKSGVKCRVLSVGSSEEYGNVLQKDLPLKENASLFPVSPYAVARVSQELLSKCYAQSFALDIVLTRSFNHIGPFQRECFVVSAFVKQITKQVAAGKKSVTVSAGNLSIIRDFLDVRDVARAYFLLLKKGKSGEVYNVCKGQGKTLNEILQTIARLCQVSVTSVLDKEKIRPGDNMAIVGNAEKIFCDTGWKAEIPLEKTLRDMIDFEKKSLSLHNEK